jgi:hypothetical protein
LGYFDPINIAIFLVDIALAVHCIRNGHSVLWILAIGIVPFLGGMLGLGPLGILGVWFAYVIFAVVPDFAGSHGFRRFRGSLAQAADPGSAYREKKRQAELTGSVDAKRALAEESINRGFIAEAIALYESAMQGPLGGNDPALLKGLAHARLLAGEGAAAEDLFLKLKALDPAAIDADAELDYARSLALQGKNEAALRQYEMVAPRYPGEEARCRFALLLEEMGQRERAQALFREILASVKGAPSYYRSRQREWTRIAQQHLK